MASSIIIFFAMPLLDLIAKNCLGRVSKMYYADCHPILVNMFIVVFILLG